MGQRWSSDGLSEVVISKSVGERERDRSKNKRASEWSSEWDRDTASVWLSEYDRSSSSHHQHLYHHHHHHHQSSSSIGIAYLSWDSNDHPMDCRKSWFLKVLERERDRAKNKSASELVWVRSWYSEWVIEWVRWKTSIIIITSSIITRHRTAMIIRWAVQQPEESASDGEWERASEWLSEMKDIDHHHHVISSISIIIISWNGLPVMGQQWSSNGQSEVGISTSVC